jgi:hypothetical protein
VPLPKALRASRLHSPTTTRTCAGHAWRAVAAVIFIVPSPGHLTTHRWPRSNRLLWKQPSFAKRLQDAARRILGERLVGAHDDLGGLGHFGISKVGRSRVLVYSGRSPLPWLPSPLNKTKRKSNRILMEQIHRTGSDSSRTPVGRTTFLRGYGRPSDHVSVGRWRRRKDVTWQKVTDRTMLS